jgi:L,D-transpeptidase YcbB
MTRLSVRTRYIGAVVAVSAILVGSACTETNAAAEKIQKVQKKIARNWRPKRGPRVLGVDSAAVIAAIRTKATGQRPNVVPEDRWNHVVALYKNYNYGSLWYDESQPNTKRIRSLLRALSDATSDALQIDAYEIEDVARGVSAVESTKSPTADQIANADVLLTTAYVALSDDLLSGQLNPKSLSQSWYVDPRHEKVDSAIAQSLREEDLDSAIARMRPADENYEALRKALVELRPIVAKGGWPTVPKGKALKRGDTDSPARLSALRQRLAAERYHAEVPTTSTSLPPFPDSTANPEAPGRYDATLAAAVAQFQSHHGIVVDSMLGKETIDAMNVPATYRLAQIAANLERYRWLPRAFGERYILVNVPAFRLEAFDSTGKALEMKVIVGQEFEGRQTPVFADSMELVVFRPYWNVTPTIQEKEIEPKIAANPGYMDRNNYEYYSEGGQQRIRQRPGPKNSLGLVKFLFPNDFNIYLHDTPQDELFNKDVRAFSHGCIRLEKPEALAQWVLGWPEDKVRAAEENGNNKHIKLPKKIPVYIAYFTTYLRDGVLYFGNDLYSRDDAMVKSVSSAAFPSPGALKSIEAIRRLIK